MFTTKDSAMGTTSRTASENFTECIIWKNERDLEVYEKHNYDNIFVSFETNSGFKYPHQLL